MPERKIASLFTPMLSGFALLISASALVISCLALQGNGPTLYESDATVSGDMLKIRIMNKGRAAQVGDAWCGAGAFLNAGTRQITKIEDAGPEFFKFSTIAPDQSVTLDMLVPAAFNPAAAQRVNLLFVQLNASTNWVVACRIPYWDKVDYWKWFEHDLKFCYEVQSAGAGRQAIMCSTDAVTKAIQDLGGPK